MLLVPNDNRKSPVPVLRLTDTSHPARVDYFLTWWTLSQVQSFQLPFFQQILFPLNPISSLNGCWRHQWFLSHPPSVSLSPPPSSLALPSDRVSSSTPKSLRPRTPTPGFFPAHDLLSLTVSVPSSFPVEQLVLLNFPFLDTELWTRPSA